MAEKSMVDEKKPLLMCYLMRVHCHHLMIIIIRWCNMNASQRHRHIVQLNKSDTIFVNS